MFKKALIYTILGVLLIGISYISYEFYLFQKERFEVQITQDKYVQGNPQGDLTVVYFSDYQCDLCRNFHPVLTQAVATDGKIRLVQRATGKDNWYIQIIRAVYAAGEQGKFFEMNDAIITNWPVLSEEKLFEVAQGAGIDTEKLSRDMTSAEISEHIAENKEFLKMWNLPRFPALIIGKKKIVMPNAPLTQEELLDYFEEARSFL